MKTFTISLFVLLLTINAIGQSTATYDVSLTTIWNETDHTEVPSGAHWSALVGATHNTANEFFELGVPSPLTNGIKSMAETGNSSNLMSEVNTAISANKADKWLNAGGLGTAVGTFTINDLLLSENFPLLTLVSMVAPSPDWFIGINSENLRSGNNGVNNGWKDTYTIDVFTYDAGTDDGMDYTSTDIASNPRVGVFKITDLPIKGNKMGTVTFTFKGATLSVKNEKLFENIKIFPNPSKGIITLSNFQNIELKNIEIYSILGKLVRRISNENSTSTIDINLGQIKKGLYLIKLNTFNGNSKTQKLIVE